MKSFKGFTLIELLVVISIIGVLSSIVLVSFSGSRSKAKLAKAQNFDAQVSHALGAYAVGIWRFEEGGGATAYDESGFGNDGTINGAIPAPDGGVYTGTQALQFDGSGDYVLIPGTSDLDMQNLTISCWNYANDYDKNMFMFEKTTNGALNTQYSLFYNAGGSNHQIYFRTYGLSPIDLRVTDHAKGPVESQWNHIVATYDSSTDIKKIYCNGVEIANASGVSGTINTNPAGTSWIGTYGGGVGYPFNGQIDDVRIYNQALSSAQIQQHFVAGAPSHGIAINYQ